MINTKWAVIKAHVEKSIVMNLPQAEKDVDRILRSHVCWSIWLIITEPLRLALGQSERDLGFTNPISIVEYPK